MTNAADVITFQLFDAIDTWMSQGEEAKVNEFMASFDIAQFDPSTITSVMALLSGFRLSTQESKEFFERMYQELEKDERFTEERVNKLRVRFQEKAQVEFKKMFARDLEIVNQETNDDRQAREAAENMTKAKELLAKYGK